MLHEFLKKHEEEILSLVESKTLELAGSLSSSEKMRKGLPSFYQNLIEFLDGFSHGDSIESLKAKAAIHGGEMLRLNYSLSHVVHSYGALCQAITGFAQTKGALISSKEFHSLNFCLDVAIASAVSEYEYQNNEINEERELQHLGHLAHELRNSLSSATIAHSMIKQGLVGTGGSTANVLEQCLIRMRVLIDRSLSEVRMGSDNDLLIEAFNLNILIDQILLTAETESLAKKQVLESDIPDKLEIETDRQLLMSIIANLIQNAIKYTKENGHILLSVSTSDNKYIIEVQDECGGLDEKLVDNLFKPFVSGETDKSGLGLGLTIVKRATSLLQGEISVHNNPGRGCAFVVEVPKKYDPSIKRKVISSGKDSVQPKLDRKDK